VIEGATLDWNSVLSMRLYELIDHATDPSAAFLAYPCPVIMSNEFWESLTAAEQKVIGEAMAGAADFQRKLFIEMKDDAVKEVIATGVTITELDQEAFVEALRPVWEKWAKDLGAEDILDTILSLRK
jgi:TRAP-type C4-dicarboxylate transport system substrate-binding protein